MKLKDLKEWLETLSKEELEKPVLYYSDEYSMSGEINEIMEAGEDLYYLGEDDPSQLKTIEELKEDGWDAKSIRELIVEIPKGSFCLKIGN